MGDLAFSHEITQCILQFHQLDKQVVFRVEIRGALRALEIK